MLYFLIYYMRAPEEQQQLQEERDHNRWQRVNVLKTEWFKYAPDKRVKLSKEFPEIAEQILILIEGV